MCSNSYINCVHCHGQIPYSVAWCSEAVERGSQCSTIPAPLQVSVGMGEHEECARQADEAELAAQEEKPKRGKTAPRPRR